MSLGQRGMLEIVMPAEISEGYGGKGFQLQHFYLFTVVEHVLGMEKFPGSILASLVKDFQLEGAVRECSLIRPWRGKFKLTDPNGPIV